MNEIVNKFLLAGDTFMSEMHLKQLALLDKSGFPYSACLRFTRNKERIQKFDETLDTNYIYKNELDKASFQHDMAYSNFKDLARRTVTDKVLRDKAFHIADEHQRGLTSMVYKFFGKKLKGSGFNIEMNPGEQLAKEFYKPVIRKL